MHRVNAKERAIQTFKNHFIAGLCTFHKQFPMQLWDQLLPQAELTLNLLSTSRINPKLSAYDYLEGQYNFNNTPLAPPGTKALLYEDPKKRSSWATHATDAYYVSPAMKHYRAYKFYIPETRGYRIRQSAKFFQMYCNMPKINSQDNVKLIAQDLIEALKTHKGHDILATPQQSTAL